MDNTLSFTLSPSYLKSLIKRVFLIDVINELNENQLNTAKLKIMQLVSPLKTSYNFASAVIIGNSRVNAIRDYVNQNHINCVIINGQNNRSFGLYCYVIISKK